MGVGGLDAWALVVWTYGRWWFRRMGVVKDLQSEDVDAKKLEAWLLKSTLRSIKDGCIGYGIPGTLLEAFVGGPTYSAFQTSMFMYPPPLRGPVGKAQGHPSAREG